MSPTPPPPFVPPSRSPSPAPFGSPSATPTPSKLTPATRAGQVVAFLVCLLAAGLLAAWAGEPLVFVGATIALGGGVAVGLGTGIGLRFTNIAGWVVALMATVVTMMAFGVLRSVAQVEVPFAVSPLVGLFVLGFDWCYVQRLRGAVVLSGLLVVPLLAGGKGWETAAALLWFGGALVAFWFLERDGRTAVPEPEPVSGAAPPTRPTSVADLLGMIGIALAIGFAAAMLIGNPSCSPSSPSTPNLPGSRSPSGSGNPSQSGAQGQNQGQSRSSGQSQNQNQGQGQSAGRLGRRAERLRR